MLSQRASSATCNPIIREGRSIVGGAPLNLDGKDPHFRMIIAIYAPSECWRPWKLVTLSIGLAFLVYGAYCTPAPDWDVPVSLIMAAFTYLTAPWSMRVLLERRWRLWPLMLFFTWFSVDGCYAIYWHFVSPAALALMRDANWPASLSLYGICGIIWLYRGSLAQLRSDLARLLAERI